MSAHASMSPSGAHRWMACPGSVAMEHGLTDTSSEAADEGTAAHALGDMCLTSGRDAESFRGLAIRSGKREFVVDEDMARFVQVYVGNVREYARGGNLMSEQRLPIDHITGEEGAAGTGDAVILTADELQVHDLKFGRGVEVFAERNPQLMMYALGALREFGFLGEFKRVRVAIHQPRVTLAPSEWDCSVEELEEFGRQASERAKVARLAFDHRANWLPQGNTDYLTPGESQCRWCKAKATCPALAKFVRDAVDADFEDITLAGAAPIPTADRLAAAMNAADLIEVWIKAIRAETERRLFAGEPVEGWKLVEGRLGNRTWSDPAKAEKVLKAMRVKHDEMYEYSLISPTSAEKLAKAEKIGPRQWPKVEALIVRRDGRPSVARETDKRPALVVTPALDDFSDLTGAQP